MDMGEIITTLATALATVIMAVFTFLTYRLNQRQSKIYEESHNPELMVYYYPELRSGMKEAESLKYVDGIAYSVVLLNPGVVPLVIADVKEYLIFPKEKEL